MALQASFHHTPSKARQLGPRSFLDNTQIFPSCEADDRACQCVSELGERVGGWAGGWVVCAVGGLLLLLNH